MEARHLLKSAAGWVVVPEAVCSWRLGGWNPDLKDWSQTEFETKAIDPPRLVLF